MRQVCFKAQADALPGPVSYLEQPRARTEPVLHLPEFALQSEAQSGLSGQGVSGQAEVMVTPAADRPSSGCTSLPVVSSPSGSSWQDACSSLPSLDTRPVVSGTRGVGSPAPGRPGSSGVLPLVDSSSCLPRSSSLSTDPTAFPRYGCLDSRVGGADRRSSHVRIVEQRLEKVPYQCPGNGSRPAGPVQLQDHSPRPCGATAALWLPF